MLGHLTFAEMFKLVYISCLPKKFLELKGKKLICPSCAFFKSKRRAWRGHGDHGSIRRLTQVNLDDGTSVDQVISAHTGLVPRIDGQHTHSRIHYGTVFMDHISINSFTHLQCSTGGIETIAAKRLYELYAGSFGVTFKSWHTDNVVFSEKLFCGEVEESNQKITFCVVGVHYWSGIIENNVGILTRRSRCLLLHAQRRWSKVITSLLWPFSWKDYERRRNKLHNDSKINILWLNFLV